MKNKRMTCILLCLLLLCGMGPGAYAENAAEKAPDYDIWVNGAPVMVPDPEENPASEELPDYEYDPETGVLTLRGELTKGTIVKDKDGKALFSAVVYVGENAFLTAICAEDCVIAPETVADMDSYGLVLCAEAAEEEQTETEKTEDSEADELFVRLSGVLEIKAGEITVSEKNGETVEPVETADYISCAVKSGRNLEICEEETDLIAQGLSLGKTELKLDEEKAHLLIKDETGEEKETEDFSTLNETSEFHIQIIKPEEETIENLPMTEQQKEEVVEQKEEVVEQKEEVVEQKEEVVEQKEEVVDQKVEAIEKKQETEVSSDGDELLFQLTNNGDPTPRSVVSVAIVEPPHSLAKGSTATLTATIEYSEGDPDDNVQWSSSAEDVATVSETGVITALSEGKTTITATAAEDSEKIATAEITVTNAPVKVEISPARSDLFIGQSTALEATVTYEDGSTDHAVLWSSDATAVATVNDTGSVSALTAGTANITAKAVKDETKAASAAITVTDGKAIASVTASPKELSIYKNGTYKLASTVTTLDGTEDKSGANVNWSSADDKIARVTDGVVTGIKEGSTTVTVSAKADPTKTAEVKITVKAPLIPVTSLTMPSEHSITTLGGTYSLKANVRLLPANTTSLIKDITWTSSEPSVATVSDGIVKAVGNGTTIISASIDGVTEKCRVTVSNNKDTRKITPYSGVWYIDGSAANGYSFAVNTTENVKSVSVGGTPVSATRTTNKDGASSTITIPYASMKALNRGYNKQLYVTFTDGSTAVAKVSVLYVKDSPPTGDESNVALALLSLMASTLALSTGWIVYRKKREK